MGINIIRTAHGLVACPRRDRIAEETEIVGYIGPEPLCMVTIHGGRYANQGGLRLCPCTGAKTTVRSLLPYCWLFTIMNIRWVRAISSPSSLPPLPGPPLFLAQKHASHQKYSPKPRSYHAFFASPCLPSIMSIPCGYTARVPLRPAPTKCDIRNTRYASRFTIHAPPPNCRQACPSKYRRATSPHDALCD